MCLIKKKFSQSGVIHVVVSDHSLTYCTRKITKHAICKHNTGKVRSLKTYNKETFQLNLINTDWTSVILCDNVIDAWSNFKSIFLSVIDNLAPIKEVRFKHRTEPWITDNILQNIQDRDKPFYKFKKR